MGIVGPLVLGGCVDDPDCGICDPHDLFLESISGINYASRKVHQLGPECEGPQCPGSITQGHYFIEPIGPCERSEDALESPRGPEEYCRLSPLVTAYGLEMVFNNLLDPTSVELVRRRPDNPQLYEVYDWKTQILSIEGPISRFNGDYFVGASGDPDRITRAVNLSCIDNLRDQGRSFSHEDYEDPAQNPCNTVDPETGLPMKLRAEGTIVATRGAWDSRALAAGSGQTCSTPDNGPDTCCSECDFILSTQVAKYGVRSRVDPGSGAVLQGPDLLRPENLRRPADGSAIECDVDGDPLVQCRDFLTAVDRSKETHRYDYAWCEPGQSSCEPETFALPYYDRLRETHPDLRPPGLERRNAPCGSSNDCLAAAGSIVPGVMSCMGEDAQGQACLLDADDPGCTEGYCVAPWFVECRAQPDTTGSQGYCIDTRFDDRAAGACLRSTAQFQVCDEDGGNCRTAPSGTRLAYCDADTDGRLLASECCQESLGAVRDEDGELRCDPLLQGNLRPEPRAARDDHLPEVTRGCLCTDLDDAPAECRDAVAATCVDEDGKVRPERAGEYAVKLVTRRGGVIYDPAIKGFEWQPADWGGVPRAAAEACAADRTLIPPRTLEDGWRANDAFDQRAENFEDFDRAMCSGQRYTVVFQVPGEGEHVRDKRGNTLLGRSVYAFETSQFHIVPGSGFPSDNLRIGACDDFALTFSNKYDMSPENLAKLEIWRVDEAGGLLPPRDGCGLGPVGGGPACARTDDERVAAGGDCVPACLLVDVSDHQTGTLAVRIDSTEFGAVLQPGERYRVEVPGLRELGEMNDPAAYAAAFWDACGMPLVTGLPEGAAVGSGSGGPEYTYDFFVDEPKCKEDLDLDGLQFSCDNAQDVYNRDQSDVDHDGVGDVIDLCPVVKSATLNGADSDRDGVGNDCDTCRQTIKQYNEDAADLGVPFYMYARNIPFQDDADHDGIGDACDNCVVVANCDGYGPDSPYAVGLPIAWDDPGRCQRDDDSTLVGDACEGLQLPGAAGPVGFGDGDDFDQDGIANLYDGCPRQPVRDPVECTGDADCPDGRRCEKVDPGDATGWCDHVDSDGDGLGDICDTCAFVENPLQLFDGIEQQGDEDGDFIGQECELGATCGERTEARPMAFHRVASSGYCCTVQLREEPDGSIFSVAEQRAVLDPDGVPVRIDCSEQDEQARVCRRLPAALAATPGMLTMPPGCTEALAAAGLVGPEDNPPVRLDEVGGDLVALWGYQCFLPPRDQDYDGVGDACDLCPFSWDPENVQYVDANGRLWPKEGAYCNGEYAPDVVCADDVDAGTGTGGDTETGTGGSEGSG
ncbi:thrombospondin type 3 repeat-containing protein [Paraliomyxa miuraensis]|uniref:thrombospondin type 3 repeat-containing protein n=1 Tax=Paraliomyxa miuraensis TaxID=376150 RepID=UPI0022584905|nr:thrombospondin type 3 repeat-containing protein [Paraliomyxa miuraensis]MCX4245678.1 thrombospondin type 3 repeat-containing protein [Paraliomyxa miuraensis]